MTEQEVRRVARKTAADWLEGDLDSCERPSLIEVSDERERIFYEEIESIVTALREGRFVVRGT